MDVPLFAVLLIRVVGATNTQLVIFSVLGAAAEMAFQPLMGRLVDRVARTLRPASRLARAFCAGFESWSLRP